MLEVTLNLAVLATMLLSIFAKANLIELDVLNNYTFQPILKAYLT